jgi:hypothetical protein
MTVVEIPPAALPLIAALGPGIVVAGAISVKRLAANRLAQRTLRKEQTRRLATYSVELSPDPFQPVEPHAPEPYPLRAAAASAD